MSMNGASPWDAKRADEIIRRHLGLEGPALPIPHALQDEFGCVPEAAVPLVAERLNVSRAEMHGVVTFYHDFRRTPAGRHVIKVCRAEACQARGGRDVEAAFRRLLGLDWHATSADGRVTLEPVFCLGLCATGPAALVDSEPVARLDAAAVGEIVAEVGR
jgi:formate dehydrogenase subunit gamma